MDNSSTKNKISRHLLIFQKIKNHQEKQRQAVSVAASSKSPTPHDAIEVLSSESYQSMHDVAQTELSSASESDEAQSKTISRIVQASSADTPKVVQENKENIEPDKNEFLQDIIKITTGKVDRNVIENPTLSADCSPDTKLDLVRRSKLQEYLYKNICEKNKTSSSTSNNSSSSCSDGIHSDQNSRDAEALDCSSSSASYSESESRKHNSSQNGSRGSNRSVLKNSGFSQRLRRRFYDDESVCIATEDLLHLKKPLIDEKNHDAYYNNHGRMEPMDWSVVTSDAEKTKSKVPKPKLVMGPGEYLLEPIPEFSNAVENSIDDDTVYKVSDNINHKNKIDKYSPLLKIERMMNRDGPKTFKVSPDDKKRFKYSKRKNHLIDKTNLTNRNQNDENKNERKSGPKKYNESKCSRQKLENSETKSEVEINDSLSPSNKNHDISNDENIKPKASTCDDESMFQFDKPKSHTDDENKKPNRFNGAKPKPHVDNSKKSSCSQNGSRQKPHFDNRNKNPSALDGQKQKSHSNFGPNKKSDNSKKNKNWSHPNKLHKPETVLDSDDESSVTNDICSLSLSFNFESLKKKLSNSKKLASVAHDVICEKTTNSANEKKEEFLLEEYETKYFKKCIDSVEDESCSKEITTIIKKEPPKVTSKTKCLNELKEEVMEVNISTGEENLLKNEDNINSQTNQTDSDLNITESNENLVSTKSIQKENLENLISLTDSAVSNDETIENHTSTENMHEECLGTTNQLSNLNSHNEKENDSDSTEQSPGQNHVEEQDLKMIDSNKTVDTENSDKESLKIFNQSINKNGNSQTIDNKVIDSASAIEIALEKEDLTKIQEAEDKNYSKEITMIIEKEPPIITSKTGCLNEPKKEVVKLNTSNEKISSENPDEKSSKFFNRPINKNGYSQTIDNEVIDSASAIEIAFEKEDISKIQEAVKKIYADLDVIDVDEKFSEKAFEEPDIQVPPFLESMDQPFNVNDGKDILSENDIEKKMESFEISFSSNCKSLENINHQIIVRDTTNCKKESSVVIEEINTSNLRSDSNNNNSSKIKSTSKTNSIIKSTSTSTSTSTDDGYDDYNDNDDDDDGFECVNLDQFGPFAAVYDKLKALQEVQKLEIENSRDLETLATERNGTPDNRSDDLKTSDVKINGSADESNSINVTLQSSHGISTSNNYSSAYASESSNLSSTLSHSSESLNSAKTEENILASVSVDEIHLDNRSLRHGKGEPYYNHLLIKRPENGSKAQGRRLKKTRDALKNYKRKNNLVDSEDGLEEEAKSSQPEKDVKHKGSLLEEIKRRKLHLNCQPKLDLNFK